VKSNTQSILFLTPFYGYTGSEVALFNIVENWPAKSDLLAVAIMSEKGLLAKENKESISHYCYDTFAPAPRNIFSKVFYSISKSLQKINYRTAFLDYVINDFQPDTVVLNTLIMSEYLSFFKEKGIETVLYVHEMDWTFSHFTAEQLKSIVQLPSKVFCCSQASRNGFELLGRIKKIETVYPGIDFTRIITTKDRNTVCSEFQIPVRSIIIGMSGSLDRNKDPRIFVETAVRLLRKNPDYFFVWIGGKLSTGDTYYAQQLALFYGISDKVLFTGQLQAQAYYNCLQAVDCFFLTSQFDSFPLVMLEATYLKKPVIGFNSGGISEFIQEGTGIVISSRNADTAANEIHAYLQKPKAFNPDLALQNASMYTASTSGFHFHQSLNTI
jgi:glycosyltransferase involved in cell wall biosynthesis